MMDKFKNSLNIPDYILSDYLIDKVVALSQFKDSPEYLIKANEFFKELMSDEYTAEDIVQIIGILCNHYKMNLNKNEIPYIKQLMTKHLDRMNKISEGSKPVRSQDYFEKVNYKEISPGYFEKAI